MDGAMAVMPCCPAAPFSMPPSTPPLSIRDKLTLAISDMGRVEMLFQITNCSVSAGRMARMAWYMARALVVWPVF